MSFFITYAQNKEDVILDAFFSDIKNGFYVDVGANHPIEDSVTKHFYNNGWSGINIEPIQALYEQLIEDRPRDIVLNVGVADKKGTLNLRQYNNTGLSTFSSTLKNEYTKGSQAEKTSDYVDIKVPIVTLKDVFNQYNINHIHFMKIDVEGLEYEVILGNDWEKFRPEMLCIESNHVTGKRDWRKILDKNNYIKVYNDGLNDYYLASEHKNRISKFSYVDTMLLGPQILPYHVLDRINALQDEADNKALRLQLEKIHAKQLQKDKETLEYEIIQQQRLKSTIKLFFKALDRFNLAQIEKLRSAEIKTVESNRNQVDNTYYDFTSREKLLNSIHHNDLQTYYSIKQTKHRNHNYIYNSVSFTYRLLRGVGVKIRNIILPTKVKENGFEK